MAPKAVDPESMPRPAGHGQGTKGFGDWPFGPLDDEARAAVEAMALV
jgi:hypothetical protein